MQMITFDFTPVLPVRVQDVPFTIVQTLVVVHFHLGSSHNGVVAQLASA
jgi:hypothetical protein